MTASTPFGGGVALRPHQQSRHTAELERRVELAEVAILRHHSLMARLASTDPLVLAFYADVLRQREEALRLARAHLELEQMAGTRGQRD